MPRSRFKVVRNYRNQIHSLKRSIRRKEQAIVRIQDACKHQWHHPSEAAFRIAGSPLDLMRSDAVFLVHCRKCDLIGGLHKNAYCEKCLGKMRLAKTQPDIINSNTRYTYRCEKCGQKYAEDEQD